MKATNMSQNYVRPVPMDPKPISFFLKGRTIIEMTDSRVVAVEPSKETGQTTILFESAVEGALMVFPPRLLSQVACAVRSGLLVKVANVERDHFLEPRVNDTVHEMGRGDAFVISTDDDNLHLWIHAKNNNSTLHLMFNTVEAKRFGDLAMAGWSSLTPYERSKSDNYAAMEGDE